MTTKGFLAGFLAGTAFAVGALAFAVDTRPLPIEDLRRFTEALSIAERVHIDKPQFRMLIDGSIKGMMASLDPLSSYIEPADWNERKDKAAPPQASVGIDMRVERRNHYFVAAMDGSPAERAGIRTDDQVIEINGVNVQELERDEVRKKLRGDPGKRLTLKVNREGSPAPMTFEMTSEFIQQPAVKFQMLDGGIAYARIPALVEMSTLELIRALVKEQISLRGVVLDLRKNPGGLMSASVGIASVFLKTESTVATFAHPEESGKSELRSVYEDYRTPQWSEDAMQLLSSKLKTVPLVVLVDSGSSSGSEVIAAALQYHRRAVIVGTQTAGNTSIQSIFPMKAGNEALKITSNRWLTPGRQSLAGIGVKPDILVADPNARVGDVSGADRQFAAALRAIRKN